MKKKLHLHRETIRTLENAELAHIGGGLVPPTSPVSKDWAGCKASNPCFSNACNPGTTTISIIIYPGG